MEGTGSVIGKVELRLIPILGNDILISFGYFVLFNESSSSIRVSFLLFESNYLSFNVVFFSI
jgi:hypothetical protein